MARKPAWKVQAYEEALDDIIEIEDEGHTVERFTDYHWRIDGKIDVWASSKKYMINGVVRRYRRLQDIFENQT